MSEEQPLKDQSPEQFVREYLQQHRDFLEKNPDILELLEIPHHSGKAVSLVERQVGVMRDRNRQMGDKVDQMITSAKDNAVLFEKTNRLVLSLLAATDLNALVDALDQSLRDDFSTEFYSLILIDGAEVASATEEDSSTEMDRPTAVNRVTRDRASAEIGALMAAKQNLSGVISDAEIAFLFGDRSSAVGSVVAVPLGSGDQLCGILALGSSDEKFYSRNTGTLFIDYIGQLLEVLLPNHTA